MTVCITNHPSTSQLGSELTELEPDEAVPPGT